MKIFSLLKLIILISISSFAAGDPPASFTYQGKLFKSNGLDPVEASSVLFKLQIRSPDGLCLLFEELHTRDMTASGGIFSLIVGEGASTNVSSISLAQVFDNSNPKIGAAGCVYTPVAGDTRRLRFNYDDGTEIVTIPTDQSIRSVPFALTAMNLQGATKDQFIQISSQTTQAKIDSLMGSYLQLSNLAAGTSNLFVKTADLPFSNGVLNLSSGEVKVPDSPHNADSAINKNYADSNLGGLNLDLTGLTNGKILTYNSSSSKWEAQSPALGSGGTVTSVNANAPFIVSNATTIPTLSVQSGTSSGQSLIWNGTSWGISFPNLSELRGIASAQQFPTNCSAAQTMIYSSITDVYSCANIAISNSQVSGLGSAAFANTGTTANKIVQLDSNAKLPAVDGSQLTNISTAPMSNMQVFDSSGTFNVPASGVTKVYVQIWGGGGGGGSGAVGTIAGGGGAAGGYGAAFATVTPGQSITVTIGAGGTAGPSSAGGNGGTTTFSSSIPISATGGAGGAISGQSPALGGTSSATINITGGSGDTGTGLAVIAKGGAGGTTGGGGGAGGGGSSSAATNGSAGSRPGGGGGGGGNTLVLASGGGSGAAGRIIVWW